MLRHTLPVSLPARRHPRFNLKRPQHMPHIVFSTERRSAGFDNDDVQPLPGARNKQLHMVGYIGAANLRDKTVREEKIAVLAETVWARGNRFIKNCSLLRTIPIGRLSFPEVLFAGYTNAGKSQLVSALLHNAKLARAGAMAGNAKNMAFFSVGDALMLVDSPGYGRWDKSHGFNALHRSVAQSLTKQYICLRKHTNLKRVYLTIPADRGANERDMDFVRFLLAECVPFTIVMNRLDALADHKTRYIHDFKWQDVAAEIPVAAQRIFDKFGSDQIPFIEVCARSGFNIDSLQKDIVFQCCQELPDNEISLKNLMQLSYSPASAAAYIEAETRYPPENEILVSDPNQTLDAFIERHKQELRLESYNTAKALGQYSLKEFANQRAPGAGKAVFAVQPTLALPLGSQPASMMMTHDDGGDAKEHGQQQEQPSSSVIVTYGALVKRDDQQPQQQQYELALAASSCSSAGVAVTSRPASSASLLLVPTDNFGNMTTTTSIDHNQLAPVDKYEAALSDLRVHESPAPLSLQQDTVVEALAEIEKSPHKYRKMLEQGWEEVMHRGDDFFCKDDDTLSEEKWLSSWKGRRKALMDKYIHRDGVRKERVVERLNAHGAMCPFIGDEASIGSAVLGADETPKSSGAAGGGGGRALVNRGGRMLNLKKNGLGGNSFSDHTFKNKGRATRKFHRWAR